MEKKWKLPSRSDFRKVQPSFASDGVRVENLLARCAKAESDLTAALDLLEEEVKYLHGICLYISDKALKADIEKRIQSIENYLKQFKP